MCPDSPLQTIEPQNILRFAWKFPEWMLNANFSEYSENVPIGVQPPGNILN